MVRFDFDETFGDDYLHFYLPSLSDETNDAEVDQIVSLLGLEPGATVLDVPCGHGRIANRLARRGFHVTGLDRTAQFLDVARQDAETMGVAVEYLEGDMRDLPWSARFDAVVCWFTSFGYFDDDDNLEVLRQFRKVVCPGGAVLIETLHHDSLARGMTRPPFAFVRHVGDDVLLDHNELVPLTGRMETDRTIVRDGRVKTFHYSVRLPTAPEFRAWLSDAGFTEISFTGRDGEPVTLDTWRLVVVAR